MSGFGVWSCWLVVMTCACSAWSSVEGTIDGFENGPFGQWNIGSDRALRASEDTQAASMLHSSSGASLSSASGKHSAPLRSSRWDSFFGPAEAAKLYLGTPPQRFDAAVTLQYGGPLYFYREFYKDTSEIEREGRVFSPSHSDSYQYLGNASHSDCSFLGAQFKGGLATDVMHLGGIEINTTFFQVMEANRDLFWFDTDFDSILSLARIPPNTEDFCGTVSPVRQILQDDLVDTKIVTIQATNRDEEQNGKIIFGDTISPEQRSKLKQVAISTIEPPSRTEWHADLRAIQMGDFHYDFSNTVATFDTYWLGMGAPDEMWRDFATFTKGLGDNLPCSIRAELPNLTFSFVESYGSPDTLVHLVVTPDDYLTEYRLGDESPFCEMVFEDFLYDDEQSNVTNLMLGMTFLRAFQTVLDFEGEGRIFCMFAFDHPMTPFKSFDP